MKTYTVYALNGQTFTVEADEFSLDYDGVVLEFWVKDRLVALVPLAQLALVAESDDE